MREAVIEAATLRLRPILMTTGAMVLGAVPLALATGAGAESRQDIGWVIVGGLLVGTLFTLFVIPVVYTYLSRRVFIEADDEGTHEHGAGSARAAKAQAARGAGTRRVGRAQKRRAPARGVPGLVRITQNALPTQTEHNWATTACLRACGSFLTVPCQSF